MRVVTDLGWGIADSIDGVVKVTCKHCHETVTLLSEPGSKTGFNFGHTGECPMGSVGHKYELVVVTRSKPVRKGHTH